MAGQAEQITARVGVPALRTAMALLALLLLLGAGLWNLGGPAPWWDEGWTLSVARQFAELGHYGRLQNGTPAPGGLEASVVVTAPVAGFFRLLGVGIWQGRVFGVLCAIGSLALIWHLARRLYGAQSANGALAVLLLLSGHPQLNTILLGRQVLGELPQMLFVLGGYLCFAHALRGPTLWLLPAAVLWWLASWAKAQFQPFWLVSLLVPLLAAVLWRQWRSAAICAGAIVAVYLARWPLSNLVTLLLMDRRPPPDPVSGLVEVVAVVMMPFNRVYALSTLLMFGLPTLLGLGYGAWDVWRRRAELRRGDATAFVRLSLLALAGSWLAWYLLLSVGVPRYLFPPVFIGSIFVALLLRDLTAGYDLRATLERLAEPLRTWRVSRKSAGAWLATLLVAVALPLTMLSYGRYYFEDDRSAQRVADYLNTQIPPDALVETYESELHFLLNRPYHYPPDQLHVELNRRSLLGQEVEVSYDPLAADPDYLVVGRFARGNDLYAPLLASGEFVLLMRDGQYEVYRRVRF
jgi:hypothetical protein